MTTLSPVPLAPRIPSTFGTGSALSARSRAEARLQRPVPDFREWESREPAYRVADRDRPAPTPRAVPGDGLQVHTDAIREMSSGARPAVAERARC